jgi:protein ImuB
MPRVISVFLPTLSTDRARRKAGATSPPPETPVILVGRDGRRRVILAADVAAQSAGLRVGMPATKAQALVQGLVIQDADPIADAEALERLAFWMLQRVGPIVAADPPDGIVIDSTGVDHLHGGEAATLAILVEKLASIGLRSRAAIADTWGAAHALARFDPRPAFVSEPGNAAHDIAPLSIAALRLASNMVRDLHVLGFDSVGDVLAQPGAPLALRFGPELGRRLDQATGRLAEPIEPIRPEALIEVRRAFAEPIGAAQTVARTIGELAIQLCGALERRGLGARRLDLICHRVDSRAQAVRVGTGLPLRATSSA